MDCITADEGNSETASWKGAERFVTMCLFDNSLSAQRLAPSGVSSGHWLAQHQCDGEDHGSNEQSLHDVALGDVALSYVVRLGISVTVSWIAKSATTRQLQD